MIKLNFWYKIITFYLQFKFLSCLLQWAEAICCYLELSVSGDCSVIDDAITANDDKESCEDRTSENITTVVNKHLSHVAALKQVRRWMTGDLTAVNVIMNHCRCHLSWRARPRVRGLTGACTLAPWLAPWSQRVRRILCRRQGTYFATINTEQQSSWVTVIHTNQAKQDIRILILLHYK